MKRTGRKWIACEFDFGERKQQTEKLSKSFEDCSKLLPNFNFNQKLQPETVSDLAVHPKKIQEVEAWLKNIPKSKFLLLTGPIGSGKTATVRVLCDSLSIDVCEWVNPLDLDQFRSNQLSRFSEFLTESKWNSLLAPNSKKVVLVEDWPNALVRNPEEIVGILSNCSSSLPVIFICSDSSSNGRKLSEVLFSDDIRAQFCISCVRFNSLSPTMMKMALKRAQNLIQENLDLFKNPSQDTIDAILASSLGDIRCALNQYYFASLLGTSKLPTVDKIPQKSGMKRKRNETNFSITVMSRDESLGLFHGLGRVFNPKKHLVEGRLRIGCDFEKLIDEFSSQPGLFAHFLFENYIKYFGDLSDVAKASEILSFTQSFFNNFCHFDCLVFGLWISVLGLMVYNEHKVSRWNQIKGPTKMRKKSSDDPKTKNLSATDLFYYNLITQ